MIRKHEEERAPHPVYGLVPPERWPEIVAAPFGKAAPLTRQIEREVRANNRRIRKNLRARAKRAAARALRERQIQECNRA